MSDPNDVKVRLGISTKLIFLITMVVCGAIGAVMYIATDLFKEESVTKVQEMNKDLADSLANQTFNLLKDTTDKVSLLVQTVTKNTVKDAGPGSISLAKDILRTHDDIISVGIYRYNLSGFAQELAFLSKEELLAEFDTTLENLKNKPLPSILAVIQKRGTEGIHVINSSPFFKKPVLTVFFFTQENTQTKEKWLVRYELRQEAFIKIFSKKNLVTAYLVDDEGNLLVHSNPQLVLKNYNYSSYPIVQKSKEVKLNNHQMEFKDSQNISYLGAFKKVGFADTSVIAQVETESALAPVNRVQYRTILVTTIFIALAFVFNFMFSNSITSPLGTLYKATEKIAEGNFDVKLYPESTDEVGALTVAFGKMAAGLQERDQLKTTFNKFHSKEIAQKIMSGVVKLGGEKKIATVFFSDIRGFTTMSERMSPDEVVNMLNEYMTEMVKIIQKHKGVVDKYVGDAIMALWGIPESTVDDAANCVRAALEMRESLIALNQKRKLKAQPELKIGIGIHTGEVLAGNIGSEARLEYTVIGDTVNLASRIEAANKELGSDILVSDTTQALLRSNKFAFGPSVNLHVKGKASKITIHEVIGTTDDAGNVKTVLTQEDLARIQSGPNTAAVHAVPQIIQLGNHTNTNIPVHTQNTHSSSHVQAPPATNSTHSSYSQIPQHDLWYLVRDPVTNVVEGPYSVLQIKAVAAQPGFNLVVAHVFREGDPEMIPLLEMPGFSRRMSPRPTSMPSGIPLPDKAILQQAGPSEWYVYGSDQKTYGPYSLQQLEQSVKNGNFTRTTYVWRQGMQNWMYMHQIPGFDRREGGENVA